MDAEDIVEEVDEVGVGEDGEASEAGPGADGVGDVDVDEGDEAPDAGPGAGDVPVADDLAGVGGGAPAAGFGGGGVVWAAAAALGDAAGDERAALLRRQRELKDERRRVQMDLLNANKRRARLLDRARGLTDADLLDLSLIHI